MEIIDFFTKNNKSGHRTRESWLKKNEPTLYREIINFSNENKLTTISFKERIWHYINNVKTHPTCLECGKQLKFGRTLTEGYGKFCSIKCANVNEGRKNKIKKTNNERYGGNTPANSKEVQNKIKQTTLNNHGVDNLFRDVDYIREKTIQKHGTDHISKLDSTKAKIAETNLKKYSVKTPLMLDKNRVLIEKKRGEKFLTKYNHLNVKSIDGDNITISCEKCDNDYTIYRSLLWHREKITKNPCTLCNPIKSGVSIVEKELHTFLSEIGVKFEVNVRSLINPLELDIVIKDKKIAFEFNGLYWHSDKYVDKNYHLNKTNKCEEIGYQLIHIFEDEWKFKQEIVKSRLKNILGLTPVKIYARKCEIKEVPTKEKTLFLKENHIQGAVGSKYNIGLYYSGELVSLMTFSNLRAILRHNSSEGAFELVRFCNKLNTTVIGGASKLLKFFERNYEPREIISYADRRYSIGNLYRQLNFSVTHTTKPNWFVINGSARESRFIYQKGELVKSGYDKEKTADQILNENNLHKIYDCGNIVYSKYYEKKSI